MDAKYHLVVLVIHIRKQHMQIMAILQKLAFVNMLLNMDQMKLMQFNDLHFSYRHTGSFARLT